jgi:hypothetical protein
LALSKRRSGNGRSASISWESFFPPAVELSEEFREELLILSDISEGTAAPQHQRLVEGSFETVAPEP